MCTLAKSQQWWHRLHYSLISIFSSLRFICHDCCYCLWTMHQSTLQHTTAILSYLLTMHVKWAQVWLRLRDYTLCLEYLSVIMGWKKVTRKKDKMLHCCFNCSSYSSHKCYENNFSESGYHLTKSVLFMWARLLNLHLPGAYEDILNITHCKYQVFS